MNDIKKILSESDTIYAKLIAKARKAKGLAKWKNLETISDKLTGKGQAQITFTSHSPKHAGKTRMLTSKDGALEFLSGYVSPAFHFAPWHLQVINPELSDAQAAEWFFKMQHPSKIIPVNDKSEGPTGDLENGWVHTCVASLYPGRSIALYKVPDLEDAAPVEAKSEGEAVEVSPEDDLAVDPMDMLLVCPYGGGSKCRLNGGSGSPWHHFHSDSMKNHLATFENFEVPKMGTFKGQPAIFFEHNTEPYVALPTKQEIYAKNGAVYKWSFLSAGPFATKQPLVSKIMNHLASRRPVIIPDFGVPEPVVIIAHDVAPSEDVLDAAFDPEVFQLVKDNLPKPGSVIHLGILKGEKLFGVVTSRTVDFYNELGVDAPFPGSDGLYYAYLDLAGKETPAFVLLAFINMFFPNIETSEFATEIEEPEEPSTVTAEQAPSPGWDKSPSKAPGSFVYENDPYDAHGAELATMWAQRVAMAQKKYDASAVTKSPSWGAFDLPMGAVWAFMYSGNKYYLVQTALVTNAPNYDVYDSNSTSPFQTGNMVSIMKIFQAKSLSDLGFHTPIPAHSSLYTLHKKEIVPPDSPYIQEGEPVSKSLTKKQASKKPEFIFTVSSSMAEIKNALAFLTHGAVLRAHGAPISVSFHSGNAFGLWSKATGGYAWGHSLDQCASYLFDSVTNAQSQYAKDSLSFVLYSA